MSVYFRKFSVNKTSNKVTLVVTDSPLSQKTGEIAGFSVGARTQTQVSFGILALTDPNTGESMTASHPTIKGLMNKLNPGDEIPGFKISTNSVTDRETGEALEGLHWVEPA
jgi:hypothetical protein